MDHTATTEESAQENAASYFAASLQLAFDSLLAPIAGEQPAGKSLRGSPAYQAIRTARRSDDASLPMGAWEHELKRADWPAVSRLTCEALRHHSKDIECVAWLLEARLHLDGFAAIAPCLTLLDTLLNRYWDTIHPLPDGGDLEWRANQISWINEKLLPVLRLTPITARASEVQYGWSDLEQARRHAQAGARAGGGERQAEGMTLAQFQQGVAESGTGYYQQLRRTLADALLALAALNLTLHRHFAGSPPSMAAMAALLEQLLAFTEGELRQRGMEPAQAPLTAAGPAPAAPATAALTAPPAGGYPIRDREDAYARLAELSEYLQRIEPHSPTPYLLRRALEWSKLDTAQLYHEIFVRSNGTLNIFELLGLQVSGHGQEQ